MVKYWYRLSREAVSIYGDIFKTHQDAAADPETGVGHGDVQRCLSI